MLLPCSICLLANSIVMAPYVWIKCGSKSWRPSQKDWWLKRWNVKYDQFWYPKNLFFGWVCWSPIPHWYKLIPWSMTAVKKNWCQSCLYDQWLVDSEPIFDPPWVIDKPSRYCHGQVRTSGTCTSGPGWATCGCLLGRLLVVQIWEWFKTNGIYICIYIMYIIYT